MRGSSLLVLAALLGGGCDEGAGGGAGVGVLRQAAESDTTIDGVRITHYTLVSEASTSGQHTGDTSVDCGEHGLTGCYHREFLCSGYGVAMQGTGIADDGNYIAYSSGGGGWAPGYTWLNDCDSARFAVVSGVHGASGRTLIEDYSIAVDPAVIPLGWAVWIDTEAHWYRADDTGGAIDGRHIDVYEGATGNVPVAGESRVYITETPHEAGDPSPYGGPPPAVDAAPPPPPTPDAATCAVDPAGACEGDVLVVCVGAARSETDCAASGRTCGWQEASGSYACLDPVVPEDPDTGGGLVGGCDAAGSAAAPSGAAALLLALLAVARRRRGPAAGR